MDLGATSPSLRRSSDATSLPKSPPKSRTISLDLSQTDRHSHRNAITESPDLSALSDSGRSTKGGKRRRFDKEELTCFKRLPSPSSLCGWKAEVYWQCTGQVRFETCTNGLNTLPLGKGRFYTTARNGLSLPELHQTDTKSLTSPPEKAKEEVQPLPEENPTAIVLEKIFPKKPQKQEELDQVGNGRRATRFGLSRNRMSIVRQSVALLPRNASSLGKDRPRTATPEASPQPTMVRSVSRGRQEAGEKSKPIPTRIETDSKMVAFRKMILDKFPTMQKAFDASIQDTTAGQRDLTRWEFSRFLTRHLGGLSREEHIKIFEFLDTDRNGMISMQEFHTAVEAAAPVKTMEDLRRKLVALGWSSMRQALHTMEAGRNGTRRLSLQEFGAALTRAGIGDDDEHQNVFKAILDPHSESGTVSLHELASAISAVSPSLLLEDIRGRLLSKYENLTQAYNGIDINLSDALDLHEFVRAAIQHWKMSMHEAHKSFVLMDHNRRRWIGRQDFETALRLAEPSLMLEEIRWKVRQRFRSILEALQRETIRMTTGMETQEAVPEGKGGEAEGSSHEDILIVSPGTAEQVLLAFKSAGIDESSRYRTAAHWCKLLEPVQLAEADVKALCDLMDVSRNGLLSAAEFERGLRLFAPSVILEDLRCSCLRDHACVADAFESVPQEKRHIPMDADGMTKILRELDLDQGIQVQAIIDLIEPSRDGGLTVSELIAALQCTSPGVQVRLPTAQRNAQAREKVHSTMAPFHKSATELRAHVRQKPPAEGDELIVLGTFEELRAQESVRGHSRRQHEGHHAHAGHTRSVSTPPMNVKQSYSKVRRCLELTTDHTPILERVRGYYSNAGNTTANDEKLLSRQHSRFKHFQRSTGHYEVLTRPLM